LLLHHRSLYLRKRLFSRQLVRAAFHAGAPAVHSSEEARAIHGVKATEFGPSFGNGVIEFGLGQDSFLQAI
jgi:hypothetical protein